MSRARRALVACLLVVAVPAAQADDAKTAPKPAAARPAAATPATAKPVTPAAPDDELLEFLGSVDSDTDDEAWLDYLSQTDIVKVARARKAAPADPEGEKK